jgi:hypothetical protein
LRVKNTAYFDIAATPPPTDTWILHGPLVGGYALTPCRMTSRPLIIRGADVTAASTRLEDEKTTRSGDR